MCNCLYCYRPLLKGEKDMHTACIKKFFGTTTLPVLDYTTEQLDQLGKSSVSCPLKPSDSTPLKHSTMPP